MSATVRAYRTLFSVDVFGFQIAVSKRSPRLEAEYHDLAEKRDD